MQYLGRICYSDVHILTTLLASIITVLLYTFHINALAIPCVCYGQHLRYHKSSRSYLDPMSLYHAQSLCFSWHTPVTPRTCASQRLFHILSITLKTVVHIVTSPSTLFHTMSSHFPVFPTADMPISLYQPFVLPMRICWSALCWLAPALFWQASVSMIASHCTSTCMCWSDHVNVLPSPCTRISINQSFPHNLPSAYICTGHLIS